MKEIHILPSAETVHQVADETRKLGVAATVLGGFSGNVTVLIAGTATWGLSVGADAFATHRIKSHSNPHCALPTQENRSDKSST